MPEKSNKYFQPYSFTKNDFNYKLLTRFEACHPVNIILLLNLYTDVQRLFFNSLNEPLNFYYIFAFKLLHFQNHQRVTVTSLPPSEVRNCVFKSVRTHGASSPTSPFSNKNCKEPFWRKSSIKMCFIPVYLFLT